MPYIVGHPVQNPSDFYGRQRQVTRLFEIIGSPQAQSVNILGLKRAGKTSFLRYIAHPATLVRYLRHPEKTAVIYIDMATCKNPAHFYYRLLAQLKMKLGQVNTGFLWKESAPQAMNIYDVEAFLCHYPQRRIVLLLDDFDQMPTGTFGRDFLTELRAMTSVTDYDLVLVTTSYGELYLLANEMGLPPTSPFFNIFFPVPLYLAELELPVIEALICQPAIQAGVPFAASEVQSIKEMAGTLPFLLQATAARWLYHKRLGGQPDPQVVEKQLIAELAPFFEQWWAQFDSCQKEILTQFVRPKAMPRFSFSQFTLGEAEHRLRQYGLIAEKGRGTAVNSTIFAGWIAQQVETKPAPPTAPDYQEPPLPQPQPQAQDAYLT